MKNMLLSLVVGMFVAAVGFADTGSIPKGVPGSLQVLGKCLSVAKPYRHEVVRLERCSGDRDQQFTFHENGSITIHGWCLDVPNAHAVDHQPIQLFDCREQLNQKFATDNQNHLSVQGKCLDVPNSEAYPGTRIQLFSCRRQANQSFEFHSARY